MADKPLMKHLRNQVFEMIKETGLDPSSFHWEDTHGTVWRNGTIPRLVYANTDFFFAFENSGNGSFSARWSPDDKSLHRALTSSISWESVIAYFKAWLSYVKREVETPDLWTSISQESNVITASSNAGSNAPFGEDEKAYIRNGLDELKRYLLTAHKLDPELVESKVNYLIESSGRVGRKDWITLLVGALVSIVTAAYLPPETTRDIFRFVGAVLRNILQEGQVLLTST
ncbi:MAG TPA: hypothetical protein VF668_12970 [Pyrinomonadaceae bacterium]|jgi:hypothetical protein